MSRKHQTTILKQTQLVAKLNGHEDYEQQFLISPVRAYSVLGQQQYNPDTFLNLNPSNRKQEMAETDSNKKIRREHLVNIFDDLGTCQNGIEQLLRFASKQKLQAADDQYGYALQHINNLLGIIHQELRMIQTVLHSQTS